MKSKFLMMGLAIFAVTFLAITNITLAQDKSHEAAMSMLKAFFADPAARADYASKNPAALQHTGFSFIFPGIQSNMMSAVYLQIICVLYYSQ